MESDPRPEGAYIEVEIDGESRRFGFGRDSTCSIGRAEGNTVVLDGDIMVSRKHAFIQRDPRGRFYLSDLGSRNGTTLNGLPVTTRSRLHDGDSFTVGGHEFHFQHAGGVDHPETVVSADATQLHVVQKTLTILVLDIRNYTGLSQALGEAGISEMMNQVFRSSGEILSKRGSWCQKYIGDAVMAGWVHGEDRTEDRNSELLSALESLSQIAGVIATLQSRFSLAEPVGFGAGINTGLAVVGNMGSAGVADHTAMGDAVNKAFRLESASKEVGFDVVVGRATFQLLSGEAAATFAPRTVHLKGYEEPETVHGIQFDGLDRLIALVRNDPAATDPGL